MSETVLPRHIIAIEQVDMMIEFMCQHPDLASGKMRRMEARHECKALWERLAELLNDYRGGVKKTAHGWSKYWSDWKNKLKKKAHLAKKKGASLTRIEKRALVILGPDFNKKRRSFSDICASSDNSCSNDPPTAIKLEAVDDDDSTHLSGDEQTNNDVNSESTNEEDVNDPTHNANDLLSNYPKWLIEVEKKRADAELLRAKAEQQRASVAARAADAALIQAEALKKLAEATSNQADALMRIAQVLEARGEKDVLAI